MVLRKISGVRIELDKMLQDYLLLKFLLLNDVLEF
jgi:hypothetical protein